MINTSISPSIVDLLRFTRTHQRHHEAMMRATGGHFNLFQVLGIGHYEVRTHSPILAELLNPRGRHGQGDVFLNLFLTKLDIDKTAFDPARTRVESERYIGLKTETTGGQIDIVVDDGIRRRILIENKIYAGDQENQLLRYYNYDQNADLIFLTLFGSEASDYSAGSLDRDSYRTVSYEKEIRDWLMDCRKEAACLPGVREMLSQYIALIEELTRQSTTIQMNEGLIQEIIDKPGNLEAFFMLREAESAVHTELVRRLDQALETANSAGTLRKSGPFQNLGWKHAGVDYVSEDLNRLNLNVRLHFDTSGYRDFCFGFQVARNGEECPVRDHLFEVFREMFPLATEGPTEPWPAWTYFEPPYRNWTHEAFEDICSGKLAASIGDKLGKLSRIAELVSEVTY